MPDLADFVLDFCRAHSAVVEPPAYGVYDVLLPDTVAAQLGIEPFQRFAFDEPAAAEGATVIAYGHPLAERMIELTRAAPACARFYINDVRLDKSGLAALARAALAFPNANLVEVPRTLETRALFRYVRFNFEAASVSDEKREQLSRCWSTRSLARLSQISLSPNPTAWPRPRRSPTCRSRRRRGRRPPIRSPRNRCARSSTAPPGPPWIRSPPCSPGCKPAPRATWNWTAPPRRLLCRPRA